MPLNCMFNLNPVHTQTCYGDRVREKDWNVTLTLSTEMREGLKCGPNSLTRVETSAFGFVIYSRFFGSENEHAEY